MACFWHKLRNTLCISADDPPVALPTHAFATGFNLDQKFPGIPLNNPAFVLLRQAVVSVAISYRHCAIVTDSGGLLTSGSGTYGQLGNGNYVSETTFQTVGGGYQQVAAGPQTTAAISTDGGLYTFGRNINGQLGVGLEVIGTTVPLLHNHNTPQWVLGNVKQVVVVTDRMMCVTNAGQLYGWGLVGDYQLGNGTQGQPGEFPLPADAEVTPVQVATNIAKVACGRGHTLALDNNGVVWATGRNNGRLGNGGVNTVTTFQVVATDVRDIACGELFSLIVKNSGGLLVSGNLGAVNSSSFVTLGSGYKLCFAVYYSAFAMNTTGDLFAWGAGNDGQLGDGGGANYDVPTLIVGGGYTFVGVGYESTIALRGLNL